VLSTLEVVCYQTIIDDSIEGKDKPLNLTPADSRTNVGVLIPITMLKKLKYSSLVLEKALIFKNSSSRKIKLTLLKANLIAPTKSRLGARANLKKRIN
jgi:hypothetical protein